MSAPWFSRRPAAPPTVGDHASASTLKRRDRSLGSADSGPSSPICRPAHNLEEFGSKSSGSPPSTAYDSSNSVPLHPQLLPSLPSRHRSSILSAASDVLGLRKKIGSVRKKPNLQSLPHTPNIIPGVIEISARNNTTVTSTVGGTTAHRDCEHEERERLRDVAAQSIGLDPELLYDSCKSESRLSLDSPQSPTQPAYIPHFPASFASLGPYAELSATLPKFNPPSSLLVLALAKQWKPRTIVLTSHSPSKRTYVHLFKGSSKDEKEIERLEVTEDSLIFVAEEDVGGRGSVIKLAANVVSAKASGESEREGLRTMWFLQITDPAESHRWIAAIKSAVLSKRAVRAGLDIPVQTNGGNEPKGDIDVMLSMHLQGIIAMHPTKPSATVSSLSPQVPTSPSPPPSLRSLRTSAHSSPPPTTTMKGIFSGTRPRSPSVEGSTTYPPGHTEDSFGTAGISLLTLLRNKSSADSSSSPSHSLPLPLPHVPGQSSPAPSLRSTNAPVVIPASDLKISKERDTPESSTAVPEINSSSTTPSSNSPRTPSVTPQGALTLSLQPPPRKSKYVTATIPENFLQEQQTMYKQARSNRSVAGDFGISPSGSCDFTPRETSPISFDSPSFFDGQPESFLPNLSFGASSSSVDKAQCNERSGDSALPGVASLPADKVIQTTAIAKRWSRQGVPLPKQLTPPSGPPPLIPPLCENNHRASMESNISISATFVADRSPSSSSSNSRSRAHISPGSASSLSPTFWKRASGSSAYSVSSTSTSDSRGRSLLPVFHGGESFSSSFGSVGGSSRPMSFSVAGSSPVAHVATTKRRSMPPPRPAPTFAPPSAPAAQGFVSGPTTRKLGSSTPQKSLRNSVAQRALRLSLISPKPPPSSALPPRPDETIIPQGHRRSSSTGTSDLRSISIPSRTTSVDSGNLNPNQTPPPRRLSIRQRLRILSTPPASHSPSQSHSSLVPSLQVSTLDLSDDNDDSPLTPYFHSPQQFGIGEHIMTIQNDPSFLQLSSPVLSAIPKPPPRSPSRPTAQSSSGLDSLPAEPDRDFVALSPPPPRKNPKPHTAMTTRPENFEIEGSVRREVSGLLTLSQHASVVSLGFVTTR